MQTSAVSARQICDIKLDLPKTINLDFFENTNMHISKIKCKWVKDRRYNKELDF